MTIGDSDPDDPEVLVKRHFLEAATECARLHMGLLLSADRTMQCSGTFLRYGGRSYLVTASHCFDRLPDAAVIHVVTHRRQTSPLSLQVGRHKRFVKRGSDAHHPAHDVAVIELTDEEAELLGVEWFDEASMGSALAQPGTILALAGFPWQLIRWDESSGEPVVVHPTPVVGYTSVSTHNPEHFVRPYSPEHEFLAEYDTSLVEAGQTIASTLDLDPTGMSGCGAFIVPKIVKGQVWVPRPILAGIQSGLQRAQNPPLLRIVRAEYVLELIRRRR